eukprot:COSAG01_NODE_6854_length_3468_cov_14.037103_1_plen_200_part_00
MTLLIFTLFILYALLVVVVADILQLYVHVCSVLVDRSIDFGRFPNVSSERVEQQHAAHASCFAKLQKAVGHGPLISNHAYNESHVNAAQIEGCSGVSCIQYELFSYEPCWQPAAFTTQLALFLLGAGHQAYFACGPWHSALASLEGKGPWHPEYERRLGRPLEDAVVDPTGILWTRTFASGTKASYNVSSGVGTIVWAQ